MQLGWITRGLRTGIVTTRYPSHQETQPPGWRGRPFLNPDKCRAADGCVACAAVCLPQALHFDDDTLVLDCGRCIMCGLCLPACPAGALDMSSDYELAVISAKDLTVTVVWRQNGRP